MYCFNLRAPCGDYSPKPPQVAQTLSAEVADNIRNFLRTWATKRCLRGIHLLGLLFVGYAVFSSSPRSAPGNLALRQRLTALKGRRPQARLTVTNQLILGDVATTLAGVEVGHDAPAAGDGRQLASSRIQAALAVAHAASRRYRSTMREQGFDNGEVCSKEPILGDHESD